MGRFVKPICIVPLVAANFVGVLQAQSDGVESLPGTMIGQIIIFLTTVAGFLFNIYRENRNRRWDLEDRAQARQQTATAAVAVKQELETQTRVVNEAHRDLRQAIDDNTALTAAVADKALAADKRLMEICEQFEHGARNGLNGTSHKEGDPHDSTHRSG